MSMIYTHNLSSVNTIYHPAGCLFIEIHLVYQVARFVFQLVFLVDVDKESRHVCNVK